MTEEKQSIKRCKECRLFKDCEDWEAQEGKWGLCLDYKPIKIVQKESEGEIKFIRLSDLKELTKEYGVKNPHIELIEINKDGNQIIIPFNDMRIHIPNDMWGKPNPKIQLFFREGWKIE